MVFLLLNVFLWAGFRNKEFLFLSFISILLALAGLGSAKWGKMQLRRGRGLRGDSMSTITYYGNFIALFLASVVLLYSMAVFIMESSQ